MKNLADTKREIVENEKPRFGKWLNEKLLGIAIDDLGIGKRGRHILVKEIEAKQKQLLSIALDKAWEDFKGVVKMEKKEIKTEPMIEIYAIKAGYNQAIDKLQKRIKKYDTFTEYGV